MPVYLVYLFDPKKTVETVFELVLHKGGKGCVKS